MREALWVVIVMCASCAAPLARLGPPPEGARPLGRVQVYRGLMESPEECVETLRAEAAERGATHVEGVTHSDFVPTGVSYHIPNPTFDGCSADAYASP